MHAATRHSSRNMKGKAAIFLVVLMAATLFLLGE
jgi:hypothetical protein